MVHTFIDDPVNEEKELKRITSLEYRVNELENKLLKEATAALEKRVEELEASLKESNEERDKLRETLMQQQQQHHQECMHSGGEGKEANAKPATKKSADNTENVSDDAEEKESNATGTEDDNAYERILTVIEKMRQDCIRAVNLKIPTSSRLPKNPFGSRNTTTNKTSNTSPSPAASSTKMPVRSRTPSCPSITPVCSRPGTPPCTVPSSPLSYTPLGNFGNTPTTGIPLKSSNIPMRSNSRPTTPIPSSPLCSPVQVGALSPTIENTELPPLRSIAIPIRKVTSNSTGYSSIPGTPISSSPLASCSSLASSPMYHGHLSSSPPSNGNGYVQSGTSDNAPHKHSAIPLRSRASSYSLSSISRPSSPFRAATMHSLFHTEKITSVQN